MTAIAALVGRILIAAMFLVSGIGKLTDPAGTEAMITGVGLPSGLAIPTGVFEVVAAVAIILGFMTRLFALLLIGFTVLATLMFHNRIGDPMQMIMAMKNIAIIGGLLCLFSISQMRLSYDSMRLRRRGELSTRDAEARAHEAELRAARAEGRAEAAGVPVAGTTEAEVVPLRRRRRWF